MHGRKRPTEAPTGEEVTLLQKKIAKYKALEAVVMQHRREGDSSVEALTMNAKLLAVNPDAYSMWNSRRTAVLLVLEGLEGDARSKMIKDELSLTATALQKNPKSYGAWHQRRWVVELGDCPLEKELALCSQFLELDERNFHCWQYRRWVAEKGGVSPEAELRFTQAKIDHNFSNYSAWHYRTLLLPRMGRMTLDYLEEELELVKAAAYTEPDDQSAWFYHRWVLSAVIKIHNDPEAAADGRKARAASMLENEVAHCMELWECEEERCKWPLVAAAFIQRSLGATESAAGHYAKLVELDPMHRRYYTVQAASTS